MNFRPQASKQATCNLPSGIPNEFPSARIIFALVRTILPPRGTKLDSTQQTWIQLSLQTFLFPATGSRLDSHASQFVTPSGPALMVRPRSHPNTPCRHCRYCHRYRQHHSRLQKPHESATEQHSRECDFNHPGLNLPDSIRESPGLNPGGVLNIKQSTKLQKIYATCDNQQLATCRPEFQMNFRPQELFSP